MTQQHSLASITCMFFTHKSCRHILFLILDADISNSGNLNRSISCIASHIFAWAVTQISRLLRRTCYEGGLSSWSRA